MSCLLLLGLLGTGTGAPGNAQGLTFGVSGARYEHVERVPFFGGIAVENEYVASEAGAYLSGRMARDRVGLAMGVGTLEVESYAQPFIDSGYFRFLHRESLRYAFLRMIVGVPRAGAEFGGVVGHVVSEDRSIDEPAGQLGQDEEWMAAPAALGWVDLGRGTSIWVAHEIEPLSARDPSNGGLGVGASLTVRRSLFSLGVVGGDLLAFEANGRVGESWLLGVSTYVGATHRPRPDFGAQIRVGWVFEFFPGPPNQD